MAQHDMNIANQGFPATRADLNNALQALATNSSGTSAPSTTFANQWWYDTTNNKLYIRNEANNAWIQVAVLDQTNNEWQITTGQISAADGDGLVFKTDDGNTRITLSDGGDVTFADGTDVITASAGTDNVRIGEGAGDSIASGGNQNVLIGKDAGTAITTGDANTSIGYNSLSTNTTATNNTAVGYQALRDNTSGTKTTAVGFEALRSNTTGVNSAFGAEALFNNTTGTNNTALGRDALFDNTTGGTNTAVGKSALENNTTANNGTAVGYQAGFSNTTGHNNTSVGQGAGYSNTTGVNNTFVGVGTGYNVTGSGNTFIGSYGSTGGYGSGFYMTSGDDNTIIGAYTGNIDSLDLRGSSDNVVLSNGNGTVMAYFRSNREMLMGTGQFNGATNAATGNFFRVNDRSQFNVSGGAALAANRLGNDGDVFEIRQDGAAEGTISVSGSTVSYNGGHLARWSRLTSNNKDTSIVKGTVMTNLDEMVVWSHDAVVEGEEFKDDFNKTRIATADDVRDAYTEDNEQLNCMAVSSVEGDPNVAGVFVNWDEADDYNDMNVAMTGDMVIRIAQGTTVARGDLLMSAGDGTAKPQGDDIVRSKTIAKVTSTNVSHTYDDGSYLVPCVLMAC